MLRTVAAAILVHLSSFLLPAEGLLFAQLRSTANSLRIPIYKSASDSIRLREIDTQINTIRSTAPGQIKKLDSLISLYKKVFAAAIKGYRNIYFPAKDHISLDSVLQMKDISGVKKISIHDYPHAEVPDVIFRCKNLESLQIINTGIGRLPRALNQLTHLQSIKIYNPKIKRRIKLGENHHVKTLVIRSDNPRTLPRSYRYFVALERLDISGNGLKRFPMGARHNPRLRELNLQNNKLTLKQKLKKHPFIETLALQHNEIRHVPKSIRSFSNLRKLSFNYNRISRVHPHIRYLDKLQDLSFYHNELSAIPSGVYGVKSLRAIDLFYNKIDTVESRIRDWKNLTVLYLSHNEIRSLPASIGELPLLEGLYLWENRLETLPQELGALKDLRSLWVNNNQLRELPTSLFELSKIEELNLSHNHLTGLPESIFSFTQLKMLSLINNPWDERTSIYIQRNVPALRARNIFVHVSPAGE